MSFEEINVSDLAGNCQGFEGAEKKIEIDFKEDPNNPEGLRSLEQSSWEVILDLIRCQIVSKATNKHFDSYVLSESSLFVYPFKVVLKTCGTTTLLKCLEPVLALAKDQLNLQPDFVFFARKNFKYPDRQLTPHTSFDDEVVVLNSHFEGQCYVLGPRNAEHWYLYICDLRERDIINGDQTLEIMMTELDETVMEQFYQSSPSFRSAKDTTRASGIANFLPGAITDEVQFTPCGYSVNGLLDEAYFTIHVTPEPHCSYVSFETNVALENYTGLISSVIEAFKPGKYTVTLFADNGSLSGPSTFNGFEPRTLENLGYAMKHKCFTEFDGPYDLMLAHYHKVPPV